jgi:hypothetical protein
MFKFNFFSSLQNTLIKKFGKKMIAIYDLDKINCSHDFLVFFQNAYLFKKIYKASGMDILILSGSYLGFKKQQFNREKNYKLDFAKSRLENIIFPSLNMFSDYFDNFFFFKNRENFDYSLIKNKYQFIFPTKYKLNIHKNEYVQECIWANLEKNYKSFDFAPLKISKILKKKILKYLNTKKKIITITLRESAYTKYRNSRNNDWKRFINFLNNKKIKIIVVRDFEKMGQIDFFRKYEIFPEASYNIGFRSALYSVSDLNFFVSGGPQTICWINNYNSISWKVWFDGKDKSLYDDNIGFNKFQKSKILNNNKQILLSEKDNFLNLIKYSKYFKLF